jgi:RimJ/RimL family protein N-acetyltransferase
MTRHNEFGQPIGPDLPDWTPAARPPRTSMNGRRVRLEPLDAARHGAGLFDAFAEDASGADWTYMPVGPFADQAAFDDWLEIAERSHDPMFFAILEAGTGAALGFASYLRIEPATGVIEVGFIAFSPRLQGTAGATETMYLMMHRAFDELGYRRYEWKCDALNARSRNAAERLGFRFEGIFRQATITKGRNRDTAWFSILDSEWPGLRACLETWLDPENFDPAGKQKHALREIRRSTLPDPLHS